MIATPNRSILANDYHFVTTWRFEASCEEVFRILGNPQSLTRWWPEVYLKVDEVHSGNESGTGRIISLLTKGWLPYKLNWQFEVTHVSEPYGFSLVASGDFAGTGEWSFVQDGNFVDVTYDWHIRAEKPLIRRFSSLLKSVFSWNHEWAMAKGRVGLQKELNRIRELKAHADKIVDTSV